MGVALIWRGFDFRGALDVPCFVATVTGDNSLYNVLGFIGPVFVVFTILGLVLSRLAILWKKDRVLLLVIVTIIVSAAAAITIVGEIIDGVIVTQNL